MDEHLDCFLFSALWIMQQWINLHFSENKIKYDMTNPLLCNYPREIKANLHPKTSMQMVIAAWCVFVPNCKQPQISFNWWVYEQITEHWASLVVQWLRICLPMQGTWVRALVWEDPTCRGATGPVSHNYWACTSGACAPQQERLQQWEARAPRWRGAPAHHN